LTLRLPVVWSDDCLRHDPGGEVFVGVRTPGTETSDRAEAIRSALLEAGARLMPAEPHGDEALLAVHDAALVDYLRGAWEAWDRSGLRADPGQDRVVPYVFAHRGLGARRQPEATWARAGWFAYDTMTLVGPGTWEAARAAVDCALTAVDLVVAGEPAAYACTRPPGHHACRECFGGSCYLNNAAVAAEELRRRLGAPVAVVDVDAHHGNGTQELFYDRGDVVVASVHVDPGAGWFPHVLGFADELGHGDGAGANLNVLLAPGAGDEEWLAAVAEAVDSIGGARGLVVSLGVDAAAGDPESPLRASEAGYREAGRLLGALGLPTVLVQEGGYDLETLGPLVRETLLGFQIGADRGREL
jgi:acetoin utilization deacetylase AcuC-like enzyme